MNIPIWTYSVALAVFGFGATLAAFGGETWVAGPEPLRKRVTTRGWLSLFLAILALMVGVTKEFASAHADSRSDLKRETERVALSAKLDEANTRIVGLTALIPAPPAGAVYVPDGTSGSGVVRLPSGSELTVTGGERISFTIPGNYSGGVRLHIGPHDYPLDRQSGDILVIGDGHTATPIEVLHPPKVTVTPPRIVQKKGPFGIMIPTVVSKEVRTFSPILTALRLSVRQDR